MDQVSIAAQSFDEVWPALRPHSCVMSPGTTKVFDGRKKFWRLNATIELCIFEHKSSAQLEVASYDPLKRIELNSVYIHLPPLIIVIQGNTSARRSLFHPDKKMTAVVDFVLTRINYDLNRVRFVLIPGDLCSKKMFVSSVRTPDMEPVSIQWMAEFSKTRKEIEDMMEVKMQQALLLNRTVRQMRVFRRQRSRSLSPERTAVKGRVGQAEPRKLTLCAAASILGRSTIPRPGVESTPCSTAIPHLPRISPRATAQLDPSSLWTDRIMANSGMFSSSSLFSSDTATATAVPENSGTSDSSLPQQYQPQASLESLISEVTISPSRKFTRQTSRSLSPDRYTQPQQQASPPGHTPTIPSFRPSRKRRNMRQGLTAVPSPPGASFDERSICVVDTTADSRSTYGVRVP